MRKKVYGLGERTTMNPLAQAAADSCGGPTALQSFAQGVEADALAYLQERWELPTRELVCHDTLQREPTDFVFTAQEGGFWEHSTTLKGLL